MKVRSRSSKKKQDMSVEYVPLDSLVHYANNPRKNDHAVTDMVTVIETVGFRVPLLVKGHDIIDGHLRAKAAKEMGMAEVPVIRCDEMSDKDVRLLRLMVNKASEFAQWDLDMLEEEFEMLEDEQVDMEMVDFNWFPKKKVKSETTKKQVSFQAADEEEYNECPRCGHTWN